MGMKHTVADARLDVPVNMLRMKGEGVPKNVRDLRRAHGDVLRRAAELAHFDSDKELAAELDVSQSQLSEWFAGTENAQTWRFEQHPRLGPAYLVAQGERRAEDDSDVVVTTDIKVRLRR